MQNIFKKLALTVIAITFSMTSVQAGDNFGDRVVEEAPIVSHDYTRKSSCFSRCNVSVSRCASRCAVRPAPVYVPRPAPVRRVTPCRLFEACAVRRPARVYVPRPAPVYVPRPTRSSCSAYRHFGCRIR